jgi:alpha-beta hydrolase superfamily lysophospholipase
MRALYPEIPLVVLGHSMGSYIAQAMVARYRPDIQGLALSATSFESRYVTGASWLLARMLSFCGEKKQGRLFYDIIYGGFNKFFKPTKTPFDWLSRDSNFVSWYMSDPLCTFVPSVRFYRALFWGLNRLYPCGLVSFPDVPMYVFSGYDDPLGRRLRSVMKVVSLHREAGRRVTTSFYPGGRHVMLAETNAEEVFQDFYHWLFAKVSDATVS